jgi:N-sulfoglucosamine sulfohydrolase
VEALGNPVKLAETQDWRYIFAMHTRREFLGMTAGAAAAAMLPGVSLAQSKPSDKPLNLLIITADDLNCDSCGWMGSKVGATPNLDAFAKTARGFAHAHSSAPICQPSREAIMTGRVPHRSGGLGFNPVNADCPTLWEVMHSAGYFTAGFNKLMHMAPANKFAWDFRSDGGKRNADDQGRTPAAYFKNTTEAIQMSRAKNQPFFINANITDPHRPFYGSPGDLAMNSAKLKKEFAADEIVIPGFLDDIPDLRKEVTQYFNSVRRFDESFGQVMKALEDAGEAERTVVAFMSDHGMSFPFAKTTIYKCGTWTPLVMRVPGVTSPAVDAEHMVSNTDVMPTLLDVLKIKPPEGMDGRSLSPILSGGADANREHVFTHMNTQVGGLAFPSRCVRTKNASYIFNAWSDGKKSFKNESMGGLTFNAMREAAKNDSAIASRVEWFLHRRPEEFYDLEADPHERASKFDDAARRDEIARLKDLLAKQMKATNDPLLGEFEKVSKA